MLRDISVFGVVAELSVRQEKAEQAAKLGKIEDDFDVIDAERATIRIEKGGLVELGEVFRDALCSYEGVDITKLRQAAERLIGPHRKTLKINLRKRLDIAEEHLRAADEENQESYVLAEEQIEFALREISYQKGDGQRHANVLFQTHFLTLNYNPLDGVFPLLSKEDAAERLRKTAGLLSAFECLRNMSSTSSADSLSEAVLDTLLMVRRAREHSRFRHHKSQVRFEAQHLHIYGSALHNSFVFWTTLRPGGYALADTVFIRQVVNGVFGSQKTLRDDFVLKAESLVSSGGGWLWLAVDVATVRRRFADVARFTKAKPASFSESNELALLNETHVVLRETVESVRGQILGYELQVITTPLTESPLSTGWHPLTGIEFPASFRQDHSVSISEHIDAWLGAIDWRAVEFQLRSCYREKLEENNLQTEFAYSCIQPLGTDESHAVWVDIESRKIVPTEEMHSLYSIKGNLSALMGGSFDEAKRDKEVRSWFGVAPPPPVQYAVQQMSKQKLITTGRKQRAVQAETLREAGERQTDDDDDDDSYLEIDASEMPSLDDDEDMTVDTIGVFDEVTLTDENGTSPSDNTDGDDLATQLGEKVQHAEAGGMTDPKVGLLNQPVNPQRQAAQGRQGSAAQVGAQAVPPPPPPKVGVTQLGPGKGVPPPPPPPRKAGYGAEVGTQQQQQQQQQLPPPGRSSGGYGEAQPPPPPPPSERRGSAGSQVDTQAVYYPESWYRSGSKPPPPPPSGKVDYAAGGPYGGGRDADAKQQPPPSPAVLHFQAEQEDIAFNRQRRVPPGGNKNFPYETRRTAFLSSPTSEQIKNNPGEYSYAVCTPPPSLPPMASVLNHTAGSTHPRVRKFYGPSLRTLKCGPGSVITDPRVRNYVV